MKLHKGDLIQFKPVRGKIRNGCFLKAASETNDVQVLLEGDPFAVVVRRDQISSCNLNPNSVRSERKVPKAGTRQKGTTNMPTATTTKPNAKALRKQAQAAGVEGWEDMGLKEMTAAIKAANKAAKSNGSGRKPKRETASSKAKASTTKPTEKSKGKASKAVSKKATTSKTARTTKSKTAVAENGKEFSFTDGTPPKALPDEGVNPFRNGTGLHKAAKLLLRGGVRQDLAEKLASTVEIHPYRKDSGDVGLLDYDKRLILAATTMRDQFGYGVHRKGRGLNGRIVVFVPGGKKDPRNKKSKN